jgi:hypothetical protein
MSRHFFLNLVNRSANKTTIPQARPYLPPVFMPPSAIVAPVVTTPAPFMSQGRMQTMQESQSSPSRAVPKQTLSIASNPVEFQQPIASAPSSSPVLPPGPASLVKTKPPALTPAEPLSDSMVNSTQSIQQPDPIHRAPLIQTDRSGETAPSPKPSPPSHHDAAARKNDNTRVKPVFQPAVTAMQNKPSVIQPGMSLPFIHNTPNVLLTPSAIEDVTTAEAHQPQEPKIPKTAMPEKQTPVLEAPLIPVVTETIREIHLPVYPDIPTETGTSTPREKHPAKLTALSQKTLMEPSPAIKTSAHPAHANAPGPLRIEHVVPVPRQQPQMERKLPGPFRVEHVIPAPEQQPPFRAQHARSHSSAPIQISIGTIDLHVNPPEPVRYQTPNRRKNPQGFDAFRQQRLYSGWEV